MVALEEEVVMEDEVWNDLVDAGESKLVGCLYEEEVSVVEERE